MLHPLKTRAQQRDRCAKVGTVVVWDAEESLLWSQFANKTSYQPVTFQTLLVCRRTVSSKREQRAPRLQLISYIVSTTQPQDRKTCVNLFSRTFISSNIFQQNFAEFINNPMTTNITTNFTFHRYNALKSNKVII